MGCTNRLTIRRVTLGLQRLEERNAPATFAAFGSPPGALPQVIVTRPDGSELTRFLAYDSSFRGGVSVAVGEIDANPNTIEVATGAGPGGGPHVRAFAVNKFSGEVAPIASFFAFDAGFRGGVNVAIGNLGGTFASEIIAAAGPGGGPHVRAFSLVNGNVTPFNGPNGDFFAFDASFRGGVWVTAGNLDGVIASGDELAVGAGPGGGPHVRIFNVNGMFTQFFAFNATNTSGVSFDPVETPHQLNVRAGNGQVTQFTFTGNGGYTAIVLNGPAGDGGGVTPPPTPTLPPIVSDIERVRQAIILSGISVSRQPFASEQQLLSMLPLFGSTPRAAFNALGINLSPLSLLLPELTFALDTPFRQLPNDILDDTTLFDFINDLRLSSIPVFG